MADIFNDLLARLRADNDLDLVAVSTDGLVVAADPADGERVETVCASAGDLLVIMTAFGVDVDAGEPRILTTEYEGGTVMVIALEHGETLTMVAGHAVNLGRLRTAARRFKEQYRDALAPV